MKRASSPLIALAVLGTFGQLCSPVFAATSTRLDTLLAGGNRLAAVQNTDGGWGYPVTSQSFSNILSVSGIGLTQAYKATHDTGLYTALRKSAAALTAQTRFSPHDGQFAAELDSVYGGNTYRNYVKTNFFDKLENRTYPISGHPSGYAEVIQGVRDYQSDNYANYAGWDLGLYLASAVSVGATTTPWTTATKEELNKITKDPEGDVTGLAGALYGLAYAHEDFDPTSGAYAIAHSLADLAGILAGYQLSSGGFALTSQNLTLGHEGRQETAYAVLALDMIGGYSQAIDHADSWLQGVQQSNGGWADGNAEYNALTGEVLRAIAVPEPASLSFLALGAAALLTRRRH